MATITKRGNTYKITVSAGRDPETKKQIRHYTTFTPPESCRTERQREKALNQFVHEYEQKVLSGVIVGEETSFREYALRWLDVYGSSQLEQTTLATYKHCIDSLLPVCGHLSLSDIKVSTVGQILDTIAKQGYERNGQQHQYSQNTLRTIRTVLSSVLSSAHADGIVASNPCSNRKGRSKKVTEPQEPVIFTPAQSKLFLQILDRDIPVIIPEKTVTRNGKPCVISEHINRTYKCKEPYKTLYITTLFSGIRLGEAIAMQWGSVDLEAGTIEVKQSAAYTAASGRFLKSPKSRSGYRTIYLPKPATEALRALKRQRMRDILRMGTAWEGSRHIEENFIFCSDTGSMLATSTPRKELQRLIRSYNKTVPESEQLPVLTFHQLRHSHASILIAQGTDPVEVAGRLGHKDPTTTLKRYAHAFAERDKKAAEDFEAALRNA